MAVNHIEGLRWFDCRFIDEDVSVQPTEPWPRPEGK
jgi:hypothetical protein